MLFLLFKYGVGWLPVKHYDTATSNTLKELASSRELSHDLSKSKPNISLGGSQMPLMANIRFDHKK